MANKVPNTRTVSTASPLLGGGSLSSNLSLSIQQANSIQSGFLSFVDWGTFNGKANDNAVVHLTGNETINGVKSFTVDGGTNTGRLSLTNNYSGGGSAMGSPLVISHNGGGGTYGQYIKLANSGTGILLEGVSSIGNFIEFVRNGSNVGTVNSFGNITMQSFIKSGGLSTEYLKADGSVSTLTNPITGIGTVGVIPQFYSSGSIGNSAISQSADRILLGTADNGLDKLQVNGSLIATAIKKSGAVANQLLKADGGVTVGYKVYTALLSQTGTNAPTAIVLENTLGTISFSYNGVGDYAINSSALFTADKTVLFIQGSNDGDINSAIISDKLYHNTSSIINCITSGSANGTLNKTSIEIRVYN